MLRVIAALTMLAGEVTGMYIRRVRLVAAVVSLSGVALVGQSATITFDNDDVGKAPKVFTFALTGQGKPGVWTVQKDDAAHKNVLVQTDADKTDYRFPVAIYETFTGIDVTLSVKFKAISGRGDQGAGLVWRFRDANNYYVTRCNALEDNCTIYHVINGRREAFQNHRVKVPSNVWHTLAVNASGDHFVVTYDGTQVLDAHDSTFKEAGKVGLWTKADSVIAFDDFAVTER